MDITSARFTISHSVNSERVRVATPLARPLNFQEQGDSEFETFACRAINARRLSGDLPAALQPYRGWWIHDVTPAEVPA